MKSSAIAQHHNTMRHAVSPEAVAIADALTTLTTRWACSDNEGESLLHLLPGTLAKWRDTGPGYLRRDQQDRLDAAMGVQRVLRVLHPHKQAAAAWLRLPCREFRRRTPLDVMMQGERGDIVRVREYIEALLRERDNTNPEKSSDRHAGGLRSYPKASSNSAAGGHAGGLFRAGQRLL
jgi:hypothetical protein